MNIKHLVPVILCIFLIASITPAQNGDGPKRANIVPLRNADEQFGLVDQSTSVQRNENDEYEIPPTVIQGADRTHKLGDIVQLWVEPIDKPDNLKSVAYSWTVLPDRKTVIWPDSTRILFGTGVEKSTFKVILTASYVFVDGEGENLNISQKIVTKTADVRVDDELGGPGDDPTPDDPTPDDPTPDDPTPDDPTPDDPTPGDPTPDDPTPDDPQEWPGDNNELSGVSKKIYDWLNLVALGPEYGPTSASKDASIIANNFKIVASEIDDKEIVTIGAALDRTKKLNDNSNINRNAWMEWFNRMRDHLVSLHENDELQGLSDISELWGKVNEALSSA